MQIYKSKETNSALVIVDGVAISFLCKNSDVIEEVAKYVLDNFKERPGLYDPLFLLRPKPDPPGLYEPADNSVREVDVVKAMIRPTRHQG